MFPIPPSIDKGTKKGSGFGRISILNDTLRVQPK
ncbi:hypothetical protein SAMN04488602_12861 [Paenibacillus sp. cl123]|nr:hypothetical protein SAMN04488602_12861 [Paenibacillus sp. cl123]